MVMAVFLCCCCYTLWLPYGSVVSHSEIDACVDIAVCDEVGVVQHLPHAEITSTEHNSHNTKGYLIAGLFFSSNLSVGSLLGSLFIFPALTALWFHSFHCLWNM